MFGARAVLLDFYGTVVAEDDELIAAIGAEVGAPGFGSLWWQRYQAECDQAHGSRFRTQRDISRTSLRHALHAVGSGLDPEPLNQRLFDYWQAPRLYDDARRFLETVDVPVCIVSNIDRADLEAAIRHCGLPTGMVEQIVTSEDVRSYKPRPEPFAEGLRLLRLEPRDVVHVGDSLSSDVAGARAFGLDAIWVNRQNRPGRKAPPGVTELARLHT